MKRIEIKDQPRLGWRRTVRITLDGVRYRLFRASVTVAVIAVAVAFLMNVLGESLVKRRIALASRARLAELRLVHAWASRLTQPPAPRDLIGELAAGAADDSAAAEAQVMGGLTAGEMAELRGWSREADRYLVFFESLDYARHRNLVHAAAGTAIFDRLVEPACMADFRDALRDLKSVRFVTSLADLDTFLRAWPRAKAQIERMRQGYAEAIRKVDAARNGQPVLAALAGADGAFGAAVRAAGFRFEAVQAAPRVAAEARRVLDTALVERSLEGRAARQAVALRYDVLPVNVKTPMVWDLLGERDTAAWYREQAASGAGAPSLPEADRLMELAATRRAEIQLARASFLTADVGGGLLGLGPRMGWLLIVSMLVCAIGISNAMLMTVTERFREIATMKCLGALDHFIMLMFALESCFLGLVGGAIGAVLGSFLAVGRMMVAFRSGLAGMLPAGDLLLGAVAAVLCGIALAAAAAVYPSFKAAKLAPMEAMRTE